MSPFITRWGLVFLYPQQQGGFSCGNGRFGIHFTSSLAAKSSDLLRFHGFPHVCWLKTLKHIRNQWIILVVVIGDRDYITP